MTTKEIMKSNKRIARVAGLLYLLLTVSTFFAGFTRVRLIMPGDAATIAQNIMANDFLFRSGFLSDLLHDVLFLFLAWALYVLLSQVNKNVALLFVLCTLASVAIDCINLLINFSALQLLSDVNYSNAFTADQLQAQANFFTHLHENGILVAQIFFGLWLLPLGYLVYNSSYFPRTLGVLLMIGCAGYLIDVSRYFLFPSYNVISIPGLAIAAIGELSFCVWLLIIGVRYPQTVITAVG